MHLFAKTASANARLPRRSFGTTSCVVRVFVRVLLRAVWSLLCHVACCLRRNLRHRRKTFRTSCRMSSRAPSSRNSRTTRASSQGGTAPSSSPSTTASAGAWKGRWPWRSRPDSTSPNRCATGEKQNGVRITPRVCHLAESCGLLRPVPQPCFVLAVAVAVAVIAIETIPPSTLFTIGVVRPKRVSERDRNVPFRS